MRLAKRILAFPWPKRHSSSKHWCCWRCAASGVVVAFSLGWRVPGKARAQTPLQADPVQVPHIRRIGVMLHKTAKTVPWTSKCLDQALAARIMLARRGIATTVYFGVKNDEQGRLVAHAVVAQRDSLRNGRRDSRPLYNHQQLCLTG